MQQKSLFTYFWENHLRQELPVWEKIVSCGCLFLTCFSENVYRQGARRWKKIYKVFGHDLEPKRTNKRTNCAMCHDKIWGIGRGGLRCNACGMFVHKKCHKFVRRPCTRESGNYPHSPSTPNFNQHAINHMYGTSPINGKTGQENRIELNRVRIKCSFLSN